MTITDKWILSRLADTITDVTELLDEFKFNEPLTAIYRFFWNDFCDWYLEWIKPRIKRVDSDENLNAERGTLDADIAQNVLAFVLDQTLRLLHPFVPFITEGIFKKLNEIAPERKLGNIAEAKASEALVVAQWPQKLDSLENPDVEEQISIVQSVIRSIRDIRNKYNMTPKKTLTASANAPEAVSAILNDNSNLICYLAGLTDFKAAPDIEKPAGSAATIDNEIHIYVHDVIETEAERNRLEKQKQQLLNMLKPVQAKLQNENFLSKAKPDIVMQAGEKLTELTEQLATIEKHITELETGG